MSPNSTNDELPVGCRFLLDSSQLSRVFHDALVADNKGAQLSQYFRAYYHLRSLIPLKVRQFLQSHRTIDTAPGWYIPQDFVDSLAREVEAAGGVTTIHPWPDGAAFAFVPTHDV